MIRVSLRGGLQKIEDFLLKSRKKSRITYQASQIADICVEELKRATPKDSGLTSESWAYEIKIEGKVTRIIFLNTNIQNGANIALLLEYGHGTATGGWVEGREYIDPVVQKNYLNAINNTWKELKKL